MLKAIETRYKGYRFRSRLEARWAVFFDALGLQWEYEPEGFDLGEAGWYLPDFYLPNTLTWVEVKPAFIKSDDKFEAFKKLLDENDATDGVHLDHTAILVSGDPADLFVEKSQFVCPACGNFHHNMIPHDHMYYDEIEWYCFPCDMKHGTGENFLSFNGHDLAMHFHKGAVVSEKPNHVKRWQNLYVFEAARKARAARFEHGECG